ncbi:MAG: CCA tRNA nucleotidyltransferase [Xanthobacteraceae bacterium]
MTAAETTDRLRWVAVPPVADVLRVLNGDGEETRVVGGAVRNSLMGEPHGDIDLATTASPDDVMRRATAAGFKAVPTGIEHGTVTIVAQGHPFEVTTLREDVETFGRKARVAFGRDWRADAQRRDFTFNALSVSPDGTVHDYVDGLVDLQARRVRFIGDPLTRIAEDYLRILRFFRFHSLYGDGESDAAGLHACIIARDGLRGLSRERVRMEMVKLVVAPFAASTLTIMSDAGILTLVLGGVVQLASLSRVAAIEAALGIPPDPMRRLGALAVQIAEDADRLNERLRLANAEHHRLRGMAEGWRTLSPTMSEQGRRALLYRLGADSFTDRVLLAWARAGASADDTHWREMATLPQRWPVPSFPLRAADFISRGVEKGPPLGAAMRAAEAAWIAEDFPAPGAALEAIAESVATTHRAAPPAVEA